MGITRLTDPTLLHHYDTAMPIAHAVDAGVDVNGNGHCSVVMVEQGGVCQPCYDSLHLSLLVFTPGELGTFLGQGAQVLCVLEEHAAKGSQRGCTTQKRFHLFARVGPWESAEPSHSFWIRCDTFF